MRTNPLLTGNVKVVVSSDYKLYLESFPVNKALSQDRLKHFEMKNEEYLKEIIPYFFDGIERDSIFNVKNDNDKSEMYDDYQYQFDSSYFSGAFYNEDVWYQEEFEYLAPLFLNKDHIPKNFMVLRVDGVGTLNENSSSNNFRSEIIDKWKFVKMFDLTEESSFGRWIKRNFIDDEDLPVNSMVVNNSDTKLTEISGIDITSGGWTTKYLNLADFISKNTPIFKSEEYFSNLWRDNNILYPHIYNFKFLFDDTPATPNELRKYSLNRYVGFYADEMDVVKTVSPYVGFSLNKVDESLLSDLTFKEVSEIPYLQENVFVREIEGRLYSFDPIKNGWQDDNTYWVEWQGEFFRMERISNDNTLDLFDRDTIIGDFLYRIVSTKNIIHQLDYDEKSDNIRRIKERVIINELSTFENKVEVVSELRINNTTANNIIRRSNESYTKLVRIYDEYLDQSGVKFGFRIDLDIETNPKFEIDNFNEADLYLMRVYDEYFVVKKYPESQANVGGLYYLQTDKAVDINSVQVEKWINNGKVTKDPDFYTTQSIEKVMEDETPPSFNIYRVNFSDIKDFDFDRVETNYANYEYEESDKVSETIEPKYYAKEYRNLEIKIKTLQSDTVKRIPILDLNDRKILDRYKNGEINPFTDNEYVAEEMFQRDFDDEWKLFSGEYNGKAFSDYEEDEIPLVRKYYREEDYIYLDDDIQIDFVKNSVPKTLKEEFGFNDVGDLISQTKTPIPNIPVQEDPNKKLDTNYIPVSSEYISSDELWEVRNNDLSPIWNKNQSICKWGFKNSIGIHDYPYRLNYSLDIGGLFNRQPNINTPTNHPQRRNYDLDYFYRFGIDNPENYDFYSLHLKESYFDIDSYLSTEFDYFEYLFKSEQVINGGLMLSDKHSVFNCDDEFEDAYTLFKGIKYKILDVDDVNFDDEEYDQFGRLLIEDLITSTNQKYKDYKFSIVFGRKLSRFNTNSGKGNGNYGIDIYLNDYWKNIVIHAYIDTDDILEVINPKTKENVNIETCPIDILYEDNLFSRDVNQTKWDELEFKNSGFGIGVRPRDFMLRQFISLLNNYNLDTEDSNINENNFIHIYEDGRVEIMDFKTTDFVIETDFPEEFLLKEQSYNVEAVEPTTEFEINNTVKNRIILDDDTFDQSGSERFTSEGLLVNSLTDINSYNDYPIAKRISEIDIETPYWKLEDDKNPSMFRFSGSYTPIFKSIPLFRPLGYKQLSESLNNKPKIKKGNYKFYDSNSSNQRPLVKGFGIIDEVIFSKVNPSSNVLKIQDINNRNKSIYPMVDEYGYDFDSRYIFASNFEPSFHYLSRRIEVETNEYPSLSGYAISFDGLGSFLRIEDRNKFNLNNFLVDDINFEAFAGYVPDPAVLTETENIVTIDIGEVLNTDGNFDDFVNVWGGYIKHSNEVGDITDFPFKIQGATNYDDLVTKLNNTNLPSRGFNISKTSSNIIEISNDYNIDIEPERYTYIKDSRTIEYRGKAEGDPITDLSFVSFKWYGGTEDDGDKFRFEKYRKDPREEYFKFDIIPENQEIINVKVRVTNPINGEYIDVDDIVTQINSLIGDKYTASKLPNSQDFGRLEIKIESNFGGSYYNFKIDFLDNQLVKVIENKTLVKRQALREVINKTSLKEGSKRVIGVIPDVTVEFWLRIDGFTKEYETLLYKGGDVEGDAWLDDNFKDYSYVIGRYQESDKLAFKTSHKKLNNEYQSHTLISNYEFKADKWYHVGFVSDSLNRSKTITINGSNDNTISNFLTPTIENDSSDIDKVTTFLRNIDRIMALDPDEEQILLDGYTANELADSILNGDTDTENWFNMIRGVEEIDSITLLSMRQEWSVSINDAYVVYNENIQSFDYNINVDKELNWDVILGVDTVSVEKNRYFDGCIDELRFWNYARSIENIRDNFRFVLKPESYLNPFKTLVGYYRFDTLSTDGVIEDLTDGKIIKDMVKFVSIESNIESDGLEIKDFNTTRQFYFDSDYYDGSDIIVNDNVEWDLSRANIVGQSDERFTVTTPKPSEDLILTNVEKPIFKKSDFMFDKIELRKPPKIIIPRTRIPYSKPKPIIKPEKPEVYETRELEKVKPIKIFVKPQIFIRPVKQIISLPKPIPNPILNVKDRKEKILKIDKPIRKEFVEPKPVRPKKIFTPISIRKVQDVKKKPTVNTKPLENKTVSRSSDRTFNRTQEVKPRLNTFSKVKTLVKKVRGFFGR